MLYKAQAEINALIAEAEAETIESHLVLPQPECNTSVVCCIAREATPNEDQCLIHSEEREVTYERVGAGSGGMKSAEMRNAEVEKALHTQRKIAAAEAVGQRACSSTLRILTGRVQPQPSTEPLQQVTADGQSAFVDISARRG